jgi:colanic acid biosynthesis glycosyl transferase WcaI
VASEEMEQRRPLRVLVVGLNYAPEVAGIAPYTTGAVEGLVAAGHEVRVVTAYAHYPKWRVAPGQRGLRTTTRRPGLRMTKVRPYVPRKPRTLNRALMELSFGLQAVTTGWDRPDVVLLVSPALIGSFVPLQRARLAGIPVVTWVQDIYTLGVAQTTDSDGVGAVRRIERGLLNGSDRVIAIHDRFRRFFADDLGVTSPIDVVRNWSHVDPAPLEGDARIAVRRRLGWADEDVIVLHAGNMGSKQGLENVVHASRVAEQRGSAVRFVLMGDGMRRADLEALDPNSHLEFVDSLPEAEFSQALAAADVLLVNERPGLTEMSVPSKLTTYWASNRPVVAAVDPGSTTFEEVTESRAGLLVPPTDPEALVDTVEKLVGDPALCRQLSQAGCDFRELHLSEAASVAGLEDTLYRAVEGRGSRTGPPLGSQPTAHEATTVPS